MNQTDALRILVVDDNPDSTKSMLLLLGLSGYQTASALNGTAAVEMATTFRPDVILLDIGLPDINGYEVCRTIRAQDWGKQICIIAITGWGLENAFSSSVNAGFDHHMVKPIEFNDLCKFLSGICLKP